VGLYHPRGNVNKKYQFDILVITGSDIFRRSVPLNKQFCADIIICNDIEWLRGSCSLHCGLQILSHVKSPIYNQTKIFNNVCQSPLFQAESWKKFYLVG
jgi:hypothetical protein